MGFSEIFFLPEREGSPSVFGAYYLNKDYADALSAYSVLPIMVPYLNCGAKMEAFLDLIDGLLLTGGFDIPSGFYQEEELKGAVFTYDSPRAEFELDLLTRVERRSLKIFAICLGVQMFNVHRGGTLVQDISLQYPGSLNHSHSNKDTRKLAHEVKIERDSQLFKILGKDSVMVNSSHHQAIAKLGQGLRVNARSSDGIIEGIECASGSFLGVQWHPESLHYEHGDHASLFKAFVESL